MADVKASAFTSETPADMADDFVPWIKDVTGTPVNRKVSMQNFWNLLNTLTAETAPAVADLLAMYDATGSATDKITLANLFKVINSFTELTDPDAGDFIPIYDATATSVKKIDYDNLVILSFIIPASDETTVLTTGTAKVTFRTPYAFTLTAVRASLTTAPTGGVLQVDINEGGTTILSTKLTIDASEKTSQSAATPPVISDSALADDAEMTIDIDTVNGSPAGLKVTLIGNRT